VTDIRQTNDEIRLSLFERAELDAARIPDLLQQENWRNRLFFRAVPEPQFSLRVKANVKRQEELLKTLQELAEDLEKMCL
jgi:hypothetical protein